MFKKFIAGCFLLVAFLGLTGCANRTNVDIFPDLTQTDNLITKGESTTQDVREIFGAPTFIGTTKSDGKTIYGYSVDADHLFDNFGSNLGKGLLTMGFGAKKWPATVKEVYFKFNEGKVEDIKYLGYAYVQLNRFLYWFEAFQTLTEEEYKSARAYAVDEIFHMYARKLAKQKGVDISKITKDEIYKQTSGIVNLQAICINGSAQVFNDTVTVDDYKPEAQSYDSTKASLIFKQSK